MSRWLFKTKAEIAAEKAAKEEAKLQRQLDKEGARMAKYYAELIPDTLAKLGVDHWLPRMDRPTPLGEVITGQVAHQKVQIVQVRYTNEAIYLQVDPRYLPYNSDITKLYNEAALATLTAACERQVVWRQTAPENGCWYVIWRDGAVNAIPTLFEFKDALEMIPANAPPLYYIAGVGENGKLESVNISMMPHMLIAGSTFSGKSVHLNQLLCQIISRNQPSDVLMMMIDLKQGAEFAYYNDLPHLWEPVVTTPEDVPPALERFHEEMMRRNKLLTERKIKTLEGWNKTYPNEKLPYILLVFDELSIVMTQPDTKLKNKTHKILSTVMSLSRSTGGHAILCTQSPRTDIIPAWIKANAPGRLCFAVPSFTDSIVVLDNGMASNIDPTVKGRAIISAGPRLIEIQGPYITDTQIERAVSEAAARARGEVVSTSDGTLTLQELLELAVTDYEGKLHTHKLYPALRHKASRDEIANLIGTLNGKPVMVLGREYIVKRNGTGRHGGTHLEATGNEPESGRDIRYQALLEYVEKHRRTAEWLKVRVRSGDLASLT